jgi:hypothetical protein
MLDELLGKLTFDPLAFTRMDSKQQLNTLRSMVDLGGVDIDKLDAANKLDYDRRTLINRQAKAVAAQRDAIPVPAGLPDSPVDTSALIAQLQSVSKHNSAIEATRQRIATIKAQAVALQSRADDKRTEAMQMMEEADELEAQSVAKMKEEANIIPPGELLDSDELAMQIEMAQETNRQIEILSRRTSLNQSCLELENESASITQAMTDREQAKADAIAAAEMPLEGLAFGDGEVVYNDLPLSQASDAEQLRISIAIAMAANPTLRILRIRDGSLLDENSLVILEEMLDESDFQCWIESCDTSGKVGIVMEGGEVHAVNN